MNRSDTLTLGTVTQSHSNRIVWDAANRRSDSSEVDIGSRIQTQGNLTLAAGNDLNASAANVSSEQGSLLATAGNDITLSAGRANQTVDEAHRHKSQSGAFAKKTTTTRDTLDQTAALATTLSGQTATVLANRDIAVLGSNVAAQNGVAVLAGNDISLTSAENTRDASHYRYTQKSGLTTSGYSKRSAEDTATQLEVTHSGSSLRTRNGDVALAANLDQTAESNQGVVWIEGSQIAADAGKVDITGKHILVTASEDQASAERTLRESKSAWAYGLPGGKKHALDTRTVSSTLNRSTLDGAQGIALDATGLIDITAARLAAVQGDIAIRGAAVSVQSGLEQSRSDLKEATKKTGANLKDLTGTFTPGQGVGFKSTLTKENAQTSLAPATLDANNITLQSTQGDLTLAAVQATARGQNSDQSGDQSGDQSSDQPGTLTLDAANNLKLASLTTTEQHSTDLKKKDIAWQSVKGNGALDETTQYTRLDAAQLNLAAGNRITADLSVKDSAAILAQEAGMGWLKQLRDDPNLVGKIDWNKIEEAHQSWNYKQQGLTPAAAAVVAIVVAYFTAGAGTAAVGTTTTVAGTTTLGGTALATTTAAGVTTYTTAGIVINTAVTSLASQATVSLINNGGDLGATLKELGSKDNLKQLATSLVTASALNSLGNSITIDGKALNSVSVNDGFAANVGKNLITGLTRATLNSAITGTDLETSLSTEVVASLLNAASAQGANLVGDLAQPGAQGQAAAINEFGRAFAHAVVGCAAGAAGASAGGSNTSTGSGCGAGALGAVVGEFSAQLYGATDPAKTVAFASMMSGIAAAVAGLDAQGVSIASSTGANAAQNNWLNHADAEQLKQLKQKRQAGQCDNTCEQSIAGLELLDKLNNRLLLNACVNGTAAECKAQIDLDPAAYKYAADNLGIIAVGRIIGQADTQGSKALASLGQALEKLEVKPLVDVKGNIQGWAVDIGSADPATLKGIFGATIFVGSEIILPVSAIELVPGLGKGLKVVSKAGERLLVKEATGEVVGKIESGVVNNAQQVATNGPLKNASGNLNNAANSARNQPFGNGASASASPGVEAAANSAEQAATKTLKTYGPQDAGPLGNPNDLRAPASTFRSGSYTEKVAETDLYFYRDYGGRAKADGRYWTPQPSTGPLQSQLDSAILPEFGNTFKNQAIIKVPKGTVYYEGAAAPQIGTVGTRPSLQGGGTQIFLPNPKTEWIIKR